MIQRPPTAELRENQTDQDSLPPYPLLDAILEGILSNHYSCDDMVAMGHDSAVVKKVFRLFQLAEYKRYQFCPIIKVRSKSFGFGHRMPLAKHLAGQSPT
jgi:NH3-dependent NAD+ synthetase